MQELDPNEADKEKRFAMQLSLWIGIGMFAAKSLAYAITGSTAILSDAAESVVHVLAVCFAFYSLRLTSKPADKEHPYGHAKIGFISAGFEGAMIILAALFIVYEAIGSWIRGLELQNLDTGLWITATALIVNGALGGYLITIGKKRSSIILQANGKHVLTDAWTSLGVVVGVALTWATGWLPLDPICAIAVAINILFSGIRLIRQSVSGLMDTADPAVEATLENLLKSACAEFKIDYHGLKHRDTGDGHRVEVHLLFQDDMPLREAHRIATEIEQRIESAVKPSAQISTHLEPLVDHQRIHRHGSGTE